MSFLLCSGSFWLAIWVTAARLSVQVYYERICKAFRSAKSTSKSNATQELLDGLIRVFRLCGWCGYGLLAVTTLPHPFCTFAYWVEAGLLLLLVVESRALAINLSHNEASVLYDILAHGHAVHAAAEAYRDRQLAEGKEIRASQAVLAILEKLEH